MSSSSSTPPVVPEPAPDGRSAAAAAELREFGMGEGDIRELVGLATTTREHVLAWVIESANPGVKDPTGFVRGKLRKGETPPEKALRKARSKLARSAPPPAALIPTLPKDRQAAIDEIRKLAAQHRPASAQGSASPSPAPAPPARRVPSP